MYLAAYEMYNDGIRFFISEANKVVYAQGVADHGERVVPARYILFIRSVRTGELLYVSLPVRRHRDKGLRCLSRCRVQV